MPEDLSVTDPLARLQEALADRYRLERELGQGGMARVYLAVDLKHQRQVALKVLRPELAAAIGPERFLREITTTANLRHPHILPLYDSGDAGGLLFYVMPFVEGESLRDRLSREGRLPVPEAVRLGAEVAEALGHAHSRGIIHRDIKPENILLESGHAIVADFGIARAVTAAGGEKMTQSGLSLGTPLYMSPEQVVGHTDLDGRSDLYSLGCVLFEMLSGELPFSGPSPQAAIARRFTGPAPEVSSPGGPIPEPIRKVVARLLAAEAHDRFATAGEVVQSLGGGNGEQPVRMPASPVLGAEASIAVLPFTDLSPDRDQEYFCEGMAEEIMSVLVRVARVASRHSAFLAKRQGFDLATIGRTLSVDHLLDGSVRTAGGRLRVTAHLVEIARDREIWSERYDRPSGDVFAVQDEIAAGIVQAVQAHITPSAPGAPADRQLVRVREPVANLDAYHHYLRGRYFRYSRVDLQAASAAFEAAIAADPTFARARVGLAEATAVSGCYGSPRPAAARELAGRELARGRQSLGESAEGLATQGFLSWCYDWDTDTALQHFDHAIALDPSSQTAHGWRCCLLVMRGDSDTFDQALAAFDRIDNVSPYALALSGAALNLAGRYEEAAARGRKALEVEPGSFLAAWVTASSEVGCGRASAAVEVLSQAVNHQPEAACFASALLAWAHAAAGDHGRARTVLGNLEVRAKAEYVAPANLAWAYYELEDWEKARTCLAAAIAERSPILGWTRLTPYRRFAAEPAYQELLERLRGTAR